MSLKFTKEQYKFLAHFFLHASIMSIYLGNPKDIIVMERLAKELAELLKLDNPQFDREEFLCRCGVTPRPILAEMEEHKDE